MRSLVLWILALISSAAQADSGGNALFQCLSERLYSEHALLRAEQGRNVRSAFTDAEKVKKNDLFLQADGRYVVRARNGREHIFEPDGRLLTTINNRTDRAHEAKVRNRERDPVTWEEHEQFREVIRRILSSPRGGS